MVNSPICRPRQNKANFGRVSGLKFQVLSRRIRWPGLQISHFTLPTGCRRDFLHRQSQSRVASGLGPVVQTNPIGQSQSCETNPIRNNSGEAAHPSIRSRAGSTKTLAGHAKFRTKHQFYLAIADDLMNRGRQAAERAVGQSFAPIWHAPPTNAQNKKAVKHKCLTAKDFRSEAEGSRTLNLRIDSPML